MKGIRFADRNVYVTLPSVGQPAVHGVESRVRPVPAPPDSVLGRAFTLLTAFRPSDRALSLAELHRRTGIPKPTALRLLRELAEWDLTEQVPGGWCLGMRLFELGELVPRQREVRSAAAPYLRDLAQKTRETVHLAVLDGTEVVYLDRIDGHHGPRLPSRIGGRMPAYCTGVGKAMLAFGPRSWIDEVVAAGMVRRTPRTVVAPGLLERDLAKIRETGVAEEHEESTRGIACAASPVLDASGTPVAAISVTGWAHLLDTTKLAPAVRTAAAAASRALREGPPERLRRALRRD